MNTKLVAVGSALVLLAGCNDSSDSAPTLGMFSLAVSDAPVDDAKKVVVAFDEVVLIPTGDTEASMGEPIVFNTSEDGELRQIDLMQYQGSNAETIISEREVVPGTYALCMYVKNNYQGNDDSTSYVEQTDGAATGLVVGNQGACYGYKPDNNQGPNKEQGTLVLAKNSQPIEIMTGYNSFVVEFDLRKGLTDPKGQDHIKMQRNAIELINASDSGHISGEVDFTQYQACEADSAPWNAITDAPAVHAVYLYAGEMDRTTMGDMAAPEPFNDPVAVANVRMQENQADEVVYNYEFGFIGPGTYSLGYTCTAYNDDPETHQTSEDGFLIYQNYVPLDVVAGERTNFNITPIL
ncbi:DUF4382 domain-containing protein [Vibrio agarivorans]|uniref:DUF4382 domain-containing protein n=1 Tax=Vibrio agarivorans TaxID=153622 RepID=UPI00222E79E7|nr:DUF4382 domain-containing protein [Vibrio agarivorans]MDN3659802.1 DUF4382 domain-containing protein [Vibrio agarivorans]